MARKKKVPTRKKKVPTGVPDDPTTPDVDESVTEVDVSDDADLPTIAQQTAAAMLAAVEPSKPNTEPEYGAGCVPSEPHGIRSREDDRVALSERKPGA